ncbi:uncharacterized protein LOC131613251 [Vicia villosa]|uniref:uncharacterized protein LOC131613251 n=1 Tax=Vicia villosa TaxID=3911 RepID=UPI00273AC1BC|nr:uncharacterized protein LOC131613251 [Vicia villosa]
MARRKKLNIRHRASDNEGMQSTPTNTNSTNVRRIIVAQTHSDPSHTDGVHESVESHYIPSDMEAEEEQIEKEPKRTRGPTRMLDVWQMEDDFIIVNLDKHGRPIGEEATTFTRFIGSLVRRHQYAPINIRNWKKCQKNTCRANGSSREQI